MKCKNARKIVYISEYPEVISQGLLEAERHMKECQGCKEFIKGEKNFSLMLRNAIKKDAVPGELINRIFSKERQQKRYLKPLYKWLAIAASILLIVVVSYIFSIHTEEPEIIGQIVNDHIQFLPSTSRQIISSNPDEIMAWFKGKVDFSVNIPDLSAQLRGGRLCLLERKRLALLFYEYNGSPISLFITNEISMQKIKAGSGVMLKNRKVYSADRGYNVLLWQERGLTYFLVSELSIEEIKKLI